MIESAAPTGSMTGTNPFSALTMAAIAGSGMGPFLKKGTGIANQRDFGDSRSRSKRSWAAIVSVGSPSAGNDACTLTISPTKTCSNSSGL